jgi:PKD repeat protein
LITVDGSHTTAAPTAAFTATPNPANVGQPGVFDGVNYFWSFGDGTIQSTAAAAAFHAYAAPGIYRVMLTVTDNDGENATEEMFVVVNSPTVPADHSATGDGSFQFTGEKASFGFSAQSSPQSTSGQLAYHDRDNKLKADITEISSLVVSGKQATFSAPCTVNKSSGFTCLIDVADNSESGSGDTFRIRINNGYDAAGTVEKGNIQVR